jgi:hypothetical protein
MQIYFNTRDAARKQQFGKFIDNGADAPKGKRYARKLSGISGNAHQRKIALKKAIREATYNTIMEKCRKIWNSYRSV